MLTIQAPAKVNLYLDVLCKRPDGFHELDTVFEAVTLFDTLTFHKIPSGIALTCSDKSLPSGPENLVYRAAQLLIDNHKVPHGVRIHLKKNIPSAAGMGGGSSDCASTLLALNRFWKLKLSQKKLLEYAAKLGSDIPFFILQTPYARGTGRGEKLQTLPIRAKLHHVLVTPPVKVPTKEIYQSLNPAALTLPGASARMLATVLKKKDWNAFPGMLRNTLEAVVLKKHAIIGQIKTDLLEAGAVTAMVSGSGPTVFATAKSSTETRRIARAIKKKHPRSFVTVATTVL